MQLHVGTSYFPRILSIKTQILEMKVFSKLVKVNLALILDEIISLNRYY